MVSNTILRQKLKINSKLEMSLLKDVTDLVIHLTTWESNEIADIIHKAISLATHRYPRKPNDRISYKNIVLWYAKRDPVNHIEPDDEIKTIIDTYIYRKEVFESDYSYLATTVYELLNTDRDTYLRTHLPDLLLDSLGNKFIVFRKHMKNIEPSQTPPLPRLYDLIAFHYLKTIERNP